MGPPAIVVGKRSCDHKAPQFICKLMGGGNRQNYLSFFLRGGAFRAEGVLSTCNRGDFFFERGCFSSRGGTFDVQQG